MEGRIHVGLTKGPDGFYQIRYCMGHRQPGLSVTLNDTLHTEGRYIEFNMARNAIIKELKKYGVDSDNVSVTDDPNNSSIL